jgi:hypothetical protein
MIGDLRKMTIVHWHGRLPEFGDVLFTRSGSRYVVHSIRPTRGPAPKTVAKLEILKLAPEDGEPDGARRFQFAWSSRRRKP